MTGYVRYLAAVLSAVLLAGGCASTVDSRIERIVAEELPRVVGPAARYDVSVQGARLSDNLVDIRSVRAVGERVQRVKAPILDRIDVTMTDVVVDRAERRLLSLRSADADIRVLASDIAAFLDARPGLDNVVVTPYPPYEVAVEAQLSAFGFTLPRAARATVRGRLLQRDGNLIMEVIDLRIAGFPTGTIPGFVVEKLINPLVDLSALPAPSRVTSVQITSEAVVLTASGSQTAIASDLPNGGAQRAYSAN